METERTTRPGDSENIDIATENARKAAHPDSFTIPEKIINFLTEKLPNAYCDDCLAEALHLQRTQVNTVTSTLGLCREYSRGAQICQVCGKTGKSATRRTAG